MIEDVVILMSLINKNIQFVSGSISITENMNKQRVSMPFSEETLLFFDALSISILKTPESKKFSDLVTFAFWCRKKHLLKFKNSKNNLDSSLGLGLLFHIAPSNVALNFAYSLAIGLLAGNNNIVRISSKPFLQVQLLLKIMNQLLENDFFSFRSKICIVQYEYNAEITGYFSSLADGRLIWGGDETIKNIRTSQLKPNGIDVGFYNRNSIAIINADNYLVHENKKYLAQYFYNDTYLNDQKACSSPSIIFWIGENKREAKAKFWSELTELVNEKYKILANQTIDKLEKFYEVALKYECQKIATSNELTTRINLLEIDQDIFDYCCGNGFFIETDIESLIEILPVCSKKLQTITYFGLDAEAIKKTIIDNGVAGCDRIVKMGNALEFNTVWDGKDLIDTFSRKIFT